MSDIPRFVPIEDARPDDVVWPQMLFPIPADVHLSGSFVEVRRFDPDRDAAGLFEALDDESVWRHLTYSHPVDAETLGDELSRAQSDQWVTWVVRLTRDYRGRPAGTVVGMSAFLDFSPKDARLEIGATAYDRSMWGSHVNPETKLLLLGYAFDVMGAGRVQLKADARNARSQQAMARLGARYEGTLRRHQRRRDGTVRDSVLFSVVAEDWPEVRKNLEDRLAR